MDSLACGRDSELTMLGRVVRSRGTILMAVMLVKFFLLATSGFALDPNVPEYPDAWLGDGVKRPPYPDVWDLLIPWTGERAGSDYLYPYYNEVAGLGKSDILFVYPTYKSGVYGVTSFFHREFREISAKRELEIRKSLNWKLLGHDYGAKYGSEESKRGYEVKLSTGEKVRHKQGEYDKHFDGRLEVGDKSVSVLFLLDAPYKRESRNDEEVGFPLDRKYVLTKIVELSSANASIFPLGDDTFILYSPDSVIALRMDGKLNTESSLLGSRLFIIEDREMKKILADLIDKRSKEEELRKLHYLRSPYTHNEQLLNNDLYKYLIGRKGG